MKYDFKTTVNRSKLNSEKWLMMKEMNPEISSDIAPFSVADLDIKTAPEITEGLKEYVDDAVFGYTVPGDDYYSAVIDWMARRHNWKIEKDWIAISGGIIPAIYNCVQSFTEENEGVILLTPVYYPFYDAIKRNGRKVASCPLDNSSGEYAIDFNSLERVAKDPNNKLILFCSPHNPVGRVWSRDEIERVGRICLDNGVTIVSDEIHFDLTMPGVEHTVFANISEEFKDNVITCTSPSKSFNLAGMLTSNIVIANEQIRKQFVKQQRKNGMDTLSPVGFEACKIAYTKSEAWLDGLIELIDHNRKVLIDFMAENIPEVRVYPLEGTYLVWMDFNYLGLDKDALEEFMTTNAEVFFDEGYMFGVEGEGFERMNIACPTDTMVAALERLKNALAER